MTARRTKIFQHVVAVGALAPVLAPALLLALPLLLLPASRAQAQLIKFQECVYTASIGVSLQLPLQYEGIEGIVGADVRVTGLPTAWIRVVTPPPHIDPCGPGGCDLFGNGAHLGFPTCTNPFVDLFLITVIPTTVESQIVVSPEKTLDSPIECPTVTLCDDPVFTVVCTACDRAYINHSDPSCGLPVEELTWSMVRDLYR